MKSTIKIFLTMLCVGLSTNLMSMQSSDKTVQNKIKAYDPTYNATSKTGITATWAQELAKQLSDDERVALIYECLNLPINQDANQAWFTRNLETLAAAYGQWAKHFVTGKASSLYSGVTGTIGSAISPVTSRIKAGLQWGSSWIWTPMFLLDKYLQTDRNAYVNKQDNTNWYNEAIRLAQDDFKNPDVIAQLTANQRNNQSSRMDLVTDKIMPVIQESAQKNGITPWTRDNVRQYIERAWQQQFLPSQQWQQQRPITSKEIDERNFQKGLAARQQQQQASSSDWGNWFGWRQQPQELPQQPGPIQQPPIATSNPFITQKPLPQSQPQQTQQQPSMQEEFLPGNITVTSKLKLATPQLDTNAKVWIDQFIQLAKQANNTNPAIVREALLKQVEITYPTTYKGDTERINLFKTSIDKVVSSYFDSQWR